MLTKIQKKRLIEVTVYMFLCYLLIYIGVPNYIFRSYLVVFGYILPFWVNGKPKPWSEKIAWLKHQAKSIHIQMIYGIGAAISSVAIYFLAYHILTKILAVDVSFRLISWQYVTPTLILSTVGRLISIAVCEDIFFRYYLDDRLGSLIHNDIIRLLLAAILFALAHLCNVVKGLDSAPEIAIAVITAIGFPFFFHFVFGFCRTKIKHFTLFSCMLGHFTVNAISHFAITVSFDFLLS